VEFDFRVYFAFGNNRTRGPLVSDRFLALSPLVRERRPPSIHAPSIGRVAGSLKMAGRHLTSHPPLRASPYCRHRRHEPHASTGDLLDHPSTPTAAMQCHRHRFPSAPPPLRASTQTACSGRLHVHELHRDAAVLTDITTASLHRSSGRLL
jgi:hypothetical protein